MKCGVINRDTGGRMEFDSVAALRAWMVAARRDPAMMRDLPLPVEPATIAQAAAGLVHTAVDWALAGFPRVGEAEYARRLAICEACVFWDSAAYAGAGRCNLCKCSRLKLWVATARCKAGRWGDLKMLNNVEQQKIGGENANNT